MGNIVTGDDSQRQIIIYCSALPSLLALLTGDYKKSIKKEACWTVSNITAGNTDDIQAIVDYDIFPPLIDIQAHAEFSVKKQAAWAVSNATVRGTHQHISLLLELGAIKPLCELVECDDIQIVSVAKRGLENILKFGKALRESGTPNDLIDEE